MQFGLHIPTSREGLVYPIPFGTVHDTVRIAVKAEELGFATVWGNDHITTQNYLMHLPQRPNYYEPLTVLAGVAAVTTRIRLATGILVLPLRNPVLLAKQVTTLDQLSHGRMTLCIGAGAYREEFEALFPHLTSKVRPTLLDEGCAAFQALLENEKSSFVGKQVRFGELELNPKAVQQPFPLWMGGNAAKVRERVGRLGHGWLAATLPPERLKEGLAEIRHLAGLAGRSDIPFGSSVELVACLEESSSKAWDRYRKSPFYEHLVSLKESTLKDFPLEEFERSSIVGDVDEVIQRCRAYRSCGVQELSLTWVVDTPDELIERMTAFAREVMPKV